MTIDSKGAIKEVTLEKLLKDIEALDILASEFDERERNAVEALKRAIDALHKEALSRLIRQLKTNPEAVACLKDALSDEVIYCVLRHHEIIKPSLQERVEAALDSIRPMLAGHGGNVELISVEPPSAVVVRFIGACSGCPASELTFSEGVEKAIKEHCPEITQITRAKGICNSEQKVDFISPFAKGREQKWHFATDLQNVPHETFAVFAVADQSVLLARFGDKVVCYQNACAHLGMPLDDATVDNGILRCPFHAFEYQLESGECLTVREVQLHTHAVRVNEDKVEVSLS